MLDSTDEVLGETMEALASLSPAPPDFPDPSRVEVPRRWGTLATVGLTLALSFLTVGVVALLSHQAPVANMGESPIEVVVLGDGHIWPVDPLPGSPTDVAVVFATEVLGWVDAIATIAPDTDEGGPVWVDVEVDSGAASVLIARIDEAGRVVVDVGGDLVVDAIEPGSLAGSRITFSQAPGAVEADISIRAAHVGMLSFQAGAEDLASGVVIIRDIPDARTIRAVLVRFRDADGVVISVAGGEFSSTHPEVTPARTEPAEPTSSTDRTALADMSPTTARADAAFPLIGLDHPEAVFDGGAAATGPTYGPSYELQWSLGSGYVEVSAFLGDPEVLAHRVSDRVEAADSERADGVLIRGFEAHHVLDAASDTHRFLWLEGGAVVEVRIVRLGGRVQEVLDALAIMDDEWFEQTTGGWIEDPGG